MSCLGQTLFQSHTGCDAIKSVPPARIRVSHLLCFSASGLPEVSPLDALLLSRSIRVAKVWELRWGKAIGHAGRKQCENKNDARLRRLAKTPGGGGLDQFCYTLYLGMDLG